MCFSRFYDILIKNFICQKQLSLKIFEKVEESFIGHSLMIELVRRKNNEFHFLTADYCDGRVRIGSKTYAAGAYVVHLLNQYYRNDTAARLGVYKQHGWNAAEQIAAGYLKETDFYFCWNRNRLDS